ncbi:MAG: MtrB/PioB family outer membrane beta-barrel protein [Pseudomonadales bacterium]|nr:MtrB/PioB family outer membrane beta-barrel protein [Pseudomonadales bacterium]
MKLRSFVSLGLILLAQQVMAEAADDELFDDFALDDEPAASTPVMLNRLSLSISAISAANHQFSRFSDDDNRGMRLSADLLLQSRPGNISSQWRLAGARLGRQDQQLSLQWQTARGYHFDASYVALPWHGNDSGQSPFTGTSVLQLPVNWTPAVNASGFDSTLNRRDIHTGSQRRTLSLHFSQPLGSGLRISADGQFEEKKGVLPGGFAIYTNAANPQAVVLPLPVDFKTTDVSSRLDYQSSQLTLTGEGRYRQFRNRHDSISWQNPYQSGLGTSVDYPAGWGTLATAPDYDQYQWLAGGSYRFTDQSLLAFTAARAETRQDTDLLPYTANPLLTQPALPVADTDDALQTDKLDLRWLKPLRRNLKLTLGYRYQARENQASVWQWANLRGEGGDVQAPELALNNRPLSREKDQYNAALNWRGPKGISVTLEYDYAETYRNYAAVTDTEEDRWELSARLPGGPAASHRLSIRTSNLAGSTYEWSRSYFQEISLNLINQTPADQRWTNHPLLRQYHVANNHKTAVSWTSTWTPTTDWSLQGTVTSDHVYFDKSELGLTETRTWQASVNAGYQVDDSYRLTVWADYRDDFGSQTGRDFNGGLNKPANRVTAPLPEGSDPARNYVTDQNHDTLTLGFDTQWQMSERLQWSTSYSHQLSDEDYQVSQSGARDLADVTLPTVRYRMQRLTNALNWQINDRLSLDAAHIWFRAADNDWQWQDSSATDKVLQSGQRNTNEALHRILVNVNYEF